MSRFSRSILGGLLFTCWMMCFVFPVSLFMAYQDHTPLGTMLVQQVVDFFALWFVFSCLASVVTGMFDDMNKRGRDEAEARKKRESEEENAGKLQNKKSDKNDQK